MRERIRQTYTSLEIGLMQEENEQLKRRIEKAIQKLSTQLAFTSSYQLNYQNAMYLIEETKSILKGEEII